MSFHKSSAFCLAFQKMIYSFVQISHIAMRFFFSLNILFSVYVTKLLFFSNLMMLSILRVWVEFYLQKAENKSVYNKGYFCLLKKQIAHNTMYVHWKNNPRTFFDLSYKFPYSFLQTPRPWNCSFSCNKIKWQSIGRGSYENYSIFRVSLPCEKSRPSKVSRQV